MLLAYSFVKFFGHNFGICFEVYFAYRFQSVLKCILLAISGSPFWASFFELLAQGFGKHFGLHSGICFEVYFVYRFLKCFSDYFTCNFQFTILGTVFLSFQLRVLICILGIIFRLVFRSILSIVLRVYFYCFAQCFGYGYRFVYRFFNRFAQGFLVSFANAFGHSLTAFCAQCFKSVLSSLQF